MATIARYNWVDKDGTEHKNDIRWDDINGGFAMCDGYEEYAQTIEAVVKTVLGELQTDREYGIPYFTTIFNNRRNNEIWEAAVRERVSELPFVRQIDSFEYQYDDMRHYLTYKMQVTVLDGTTITAEG